MNHLGLFEGIGGFSLAARWAGWHTVAWCEINPFGQQVLRHHFPNAKGHDDITKTDFTIYRGTVDIITGGFPCQPYSLAGKRLGKEDERHLWPQMLRAIREVQPRWVVGENVYGLVNWSDGLVFEEVQTELEAEGYEVLAFVLPAAGVGAPHRRDRVWFVAYSTSQSSERMRFEQRNAGESQQGQFGGSCGGMGDRVAANASSHRRQRQRQRIALEKGLQPRFEPSWQLAGRLKGFCVQGVATNAYLQPVNDSNSRGNSKVISEPRQEAGKFDRVDSNSDATHSSNARLQRSKEQGGAAGIRQESHEQPAGCVRTAWDKFPTQPPVCSRDDGFSAKLDGITFSKWRSESVKAYGNAIVPQVALQIFNSINQFENELAKL